MLELSSPVTVSFLPSVKNAKYLIIFNNSRDMGDIDSQFSGVLSWRQSMHNRQSKKDLEIPQISKDFLDQQISNK